MANTVIGSSIVVDGEISGEEPLVILGTVKGKVVAAGHVSVEAGATVEADIEGQNVTVGGKLTGNVTARERLELRPESKMIGNAKAPRIVVADGATFKGNVDMDV
ncbi:MAG: polymer-forming cytoskeletal protein [Deltaproteobacteria bacterium]|nr:polymer-forming cytoskeletal protein [Deltaproteobacteria bacterium]